MVSSPSTGTGSQGGLRMARDVVLAAHSRPMDDAERVDALRALEELKSAAAAAQARIAVAFEASQRAEQAAAGVRARHQGRGIGAQVGLARRESPNRGVRHLGLAKVLVGEMPCTLHALEAGALTEWQATLMARETAILSAEHRAAVDETVSGHPETVAALGDAALAARARRQAQQLDPAAAVKRAARAAADRRVTIRPLPDTMTQVSALLPVGQGVAVFAALKQAADVARADGDPRGRGQVMADTLVERVTGQTEADGVPVAVTLVCPIESLLPTASTSQDEAHEPSWVQGYGYVPAGWARELIRASITKLGTQAAGWTRRLVTEPVGGQAVAMDSRARRFPDGLAELIGVRDLGICRTPWCEAPIRHVDHVEGIDEGGQTCELNGQGLCEACNYAKQAAGWTARPRPDRHTVETTTPTGHTYTSASPPLPGAQADWGSDYSALADRVFAWPSAFWPSAS